MFRRCEIPVYAIPVLIGIASVACSTSPQERAAKYLRRSQARLAKKDYARALLELTNAIGATPRDAELYYQRGLVQLESRNLRAAAGDFRKATELNPKHSGAQLKLAELMMLSRNKEFLQDAANRLENVLIATPDNPEVIDNLANAEFRLGKTEDAGKLLDSALQKFPSHLLSAVALARLKLSQKDFGGAEEIIKKAVASAPGSSEAELALGQLYVLLKRPDEAEAALRRALQIDPKNVRALKSLADIQIAGHRLDEADQTYKQIAALPGGAYKSQHAIFLYETGKRAAALAEFEVLAKSDPDDRATRGRLIELYQEQNKSSEAQKVLEAALKKNDKDTDALFQRGHLYLKTGRAAEAEKDFLTILHIQPDSAKVRYALAGIHEALGRERSARQELTEALRSDPTMLPARLDLARSLLHANEAKAALALLDQSPPRQKKTLDLIVARNWALLATGRTDELRSILSQMLTVGRFTDFVLQDAILKMQGKDYGSARIDLEELVKRDPEDVRAVRLLLDTYIAQKDTAKALQRLTEIVANRPNSAPLQHLLGQAYLNAGNLPAARKAFESAKAADVGFLNADLALAELDCKENRLEAARQRLIGIAASNPGDVSVLLLLASIEKQAGNLPAAVARYRSVIDLDGANLVALNNLAYEMAVDDPDVALKFAQQAAEIAPDNPTVQDTLGWVYYRKGIYGTAVNYLKMAVAKGSTPRRQFHLAMSYMKSGEKDLGRRMLLAALQQEPSLAKTEQGW